MKIRRLLLSLLLISLLTQCSKSIKTESNFQARFDVLMNTSEQLDANRNGSIQDYTVISSEIKELLTANPDLIKMSENRKKAEEYLIKYTPFTCGVIFTEPDEKLYSSTGFASPIIADINCSLESIPPPFIIALSGNQSLLLDKHKSDVNFSSLNENKFTLEFQISQASISSEENKISIKAYYTAYSLVEVLSRAFNIKSDITITTNPGLYTLKTKPSGQNSQYEEYADMMVESKYQSTAGERDFMVEVKIADNGQFTIGGVLKDREYDLMYGHPNSTPPDGIGTSFVSIKIDNNIYRISDLIDTNLEKKEDGTIEFSGILPDEEVKVIQRLKPEKSGDIIRTNIEVIAINLGKNQKRIGVRFLIDTWAGNNDGVPFLLPSGGSKRIETGELEFTPSAATMWQTFDPIQLATAEDDGLVFLQNIFTGKNLVAPDRIAFASWPSAHESEWEYFVNNDTRVTGDSAVILWWDPSPVNPGKNLTVSTQLGSIKQKKEPVVFLTDEENNMYFAILTYFNTTEQKKNVKFSMNLTKGELAVQNLNDMEAELEPGDFFIKAVPLQVFAEEASTLIVTENTGEVKKYSFPINKHIPWNKLTVLPVVEPRTSVPVNYFNKDKLNLKARIVDGTGRTIETVELKRNIWSDGFRYTGKLLLPDDVEGRIFVEVYR